MERILAINPGATSTKIAVFDGEQRVCEERVEHQGGELRPYPRVFEQYEYRLGLVRSALARAGIALETLDAVVGRGGLLRPLQGGVYAVNEAMLADLQEAARGEHASNLGAALADGIARPLGIPALIVDPVSIDEFEPEARLSGLPDLPRVSLWHALNSKAVARRVAAEMGKRYEEVNLVVAHLGSGVSVSPHRRGRVIDVNNALEEGPFSPDRAGGLPAHLLVKLCFSGKFTQSQLLNYMTKEGGMNAYLGTKDIREAERRAAEGDEFADLVLRAMAYQVAKEIGAMAAALAGAVDRVVLTGGIAYSTRMLADISARVQFIAPVVVIPGEEELASLAAGALRVLRGEEPAQLY